MAEKCREASKKKKKKDLRNSFRYTCFRCCIMLSHHYLSDLFCLLVLFDKTYITPERLMLKAVKMINE